MRRPTLVLAAAILGIGLGTAALAASIKPETAVNYRQGLYHAIAWNFAPMAQMVQGKQPWNQTDFAKRAGNVAFYSTQLLQGFTPGSLTPKSEAKPGIWQHWDDFSARMRDFESAAANLAAVAQRGDEAATRAAFKQTADTCKACHDHYRRE